MTAFKHISLAFGLIVSSLPVSAELSTYTSATGNVFELEGDVIRDVTNQIEYLAPSTFYNANTGRYDTEGTGPVMHNGYQYEWAGINDFMLLTNTWLDENESGADFEQGNYYNTYLSNSTYEPRIVALIDALGYGDTDPYVNGIGYRNHGFVDREDMEPSKNLWIYLENEYDNTGTYFSRGRLHSYQYFDQDGNLYNESEPYLVGVDFTLFNYDNFDSTNDFYGSQSFGMLYMRDIADVNAPLASIGALCAFCLIGFRKRKPASRDS